MLSDSNAYQPQPALPMKGDGRHKPMASAGPQVPNRHGESPITMCQSRRKKKTMCQSGRTKCLFSDLSTYDPEDWEFATDSCTPSLPTSTLRFYCWLSQSGKLCLTINIQTGKSLFPQSHNKCSVEGPCLCAMENQAAMHILTCCIFMVREWGECLWHWCDWIWACEVMGTSPN